ncbi:probable RNA-binding protein 18 isoform X2 [Macrosteles quadrilineatus]|uniref:probable RNA-binding protein 18 isoform X2 n=1 Tax=Macrosteles quadrilineatus TaxID=74068 RepID=UPI0023E0AF25|nr:probable RNA-binding protein 18 isoform X2 [Macrosteles quadrilineatus]
MPLEKVLPVPEPPAIQQSLENRRLWIGNLDASVSEYHLLKTLEKYGRLEKFDMLFHRTGPLAGQPRGYAFVTYSTKEEAEQMKEALDGKKMGNKYIAVRWAHNLNTEEKEKQKVELDIPVLTGGKNEQKSNYKNTSNRGEVENDGEQLRK